jgi:hypothetical protein
MDCRQPRREEERRVKELLEVIYPGLQVCEHEDGTRDKMHDLDLCWPDGRIEAMEVTSAASGEVSAMRAAARDLLNPQFAMVQAVKVSQTWVVALGAKPHWKDVRPHLEEIHRNLDVRLAELEAEGTSSLHPWQMKPWSKAGQALRDLGVVTAVALPANPDPLIFLQPPHPEELEPAVANLLNHEIEANAKANADKLGLSGRNERHLFVWIDRIHPLWTVFESMLLEEGWDLLPLETPNLPPEVTTAWAATEVFDTVVWRVHRSMQWEEVFRAPR